MRVVSLEGIHRSYQKGVEVLKGVDLAVERGEIVSLVGKNGAGKTTLLRIAMGLLHAQRGAVRIFEMDPWERPVEVKRRIGYVSEEQALPPFLPVSGVLALHRELFPTWDEALAGEFLERFDLDPGVRIATLSKGQARQVAFLARSPTIPSCSSSTSRRAASTLGPPRIPRGGDLPPQPRRGHDPVLVPSHDGRRALAGRVVHPRGHSSRPRAGHAARGVLAGPPRTPRTRCVACRLRGPPTAARALHAVFEGERRGRGADRAALRRCRGVRDLSLEDLFIELVEAQS
jgi:hypothetical protein